MDSEMKYAPSGAKIRCHKCGYEANISFIFGRPTNAEARCCGHEWYQGACIHCTITVNEWRSRPPAQHEPLGNESAKLAGGE